MRLAWGDALAVLGAIAEPEDYNLRESGFLSFDAGGAHQLRLGLDGFIVHEALLALSDLDYIEWNEWQYTGGPTLDVTGLRVTGRGMQALGQWPSLLTATTPASLSHVLEMVAPYAADPEKAGVLREAAKEARRLTGPVLRRALVSGTVAVVREKLGLR
jgi:hypothetical protein